MRAFQGQIGFQQPGVDFGRSVAADLTQLTCDFIEDELVGFYAGFLQRLGQGDAATLALPLVG